jgi:hypothetical protein
MSFFAVFLVFSMVACLWVFQNWENEGITFRFANWLADRTPQCVAWLVLFLVSWGFFSFLLGG